MPRAAGPFKVLAKINDNAYILDLPAKFGVSTSFNVADLKPYASEDEELPSRMTSVQGGEDDEDTTSTSTPAAPQAPPDVPPLQAPLVGPITRACVRELNYIMLLKNEGPEAQRKAQQGARMGRLGLGTAPTSWPRLSSSCGAPPFPLRLFGAASPYLGQCPFSFTT